MAAWATLLINPLVAATYPLPIEMNQERVRFNAFSLSGLPIPAPEPIVILPAAVANLSGVAGPRPQVARQSVGIGREIVHAELVIVRVHMPGALPIKLV